MRSLPPRASKVWLGRVRHWPRAIFPLAAILCALGTTMACETPVYRYAMYRWQPTPYEVYSFHDEATADAHAGVEKAIADVSAGTDNRANVVFIPVNLTTDPELNGVTPDIKAAWEARREEVTALPSYLISTPYGAQIYSGQLDANAIGALVESPARKQMAQHLEAGKIGVLLFLSGQDQQENEATRKILQQLVKEVAEGKIDLYSVPTAEKPEDGAAEAKPGLELGMIEINREDESEAWLVRSLLAMEPDLPEEKRPMVFLTYGRGRALLPYIGAGITRENLIHEVEFISGACSCTVKEQNPGVDLLVRYDWDAASAALADRFGTEEGNESQFGPTDFLPQLIIPSATAGEDVAGASADPDDTTELVADPAATVDTQDQAGQPGAQASAEIPVVTDEPPSLPNPDPGTSASETRGDLVAVTPAEAFAESQPPVFKTQRSNFSMLVVGGGLALGLVILFGLTFFVMRPH